MVKYGRFREKSCSKRCFSVKILRKDSHPTKSMATPSKRIPVNGLQGGLNAAFSALNIEGLPEGPAVEPPEVSADYGVAVKSGRVVLRRERAQRGGKTVLVVDGFGEQHSMQGIEALGKRLRSACGCGGTVRGRSLEVQGDQAARVRSFLEGEGFQVAGER
jgi:translation initiation factor 1